MAKYLKQDTPKNKKKRPVILLILLLLVIAACVAVIVYELNKWYPKDAIDYGMFRKPSPTASEVIVPGFDEPGTVIVTPTADSDGLLENPVRFADLQAVNPDIYAWVYVPGTEVDYPVLMSSEDEPEDFYLHRNIYKEYEYQGVVYTQKLNSKDFTDRVTVIYGHNMLNNSMFSTLIDFLDEDFFNEHDVFYIYTPGHILTYKIVSAHQYDKRHLLNSFDFSDDEVFLDWQKMIQNPKTFRCHVREDIDLSLEDRFVTLSTCINSGKNRYLIQGVLICDEPTK